MHFLSLLFACLTFAISASFGRSHKPYYSTPVKSGSKKTTTTTKASSRSRQIHHKGSRTEIVHEEGSCYAPHFECPDWAPCCSKEGFCGNTAVYCSHKHCLANCWPKERSSSSDEDHRRRRSSRQSSRSSYKSSGRSTNPNATSRPTYFARR